MGVFVKNGWYWIDFRDAEGRRHRQKASLEHQIAKRMLRDKLGAIARGEITGIREEGTLLKDFIEKKYWPTIKESLSESEQRRARWTIDLQLIPCLGGLRASKICREDIERFQAERLAAVSSGTVKKEMMRLKHILNRAVAWRYIKDTPAKGIPKVTPPPGRIRYLSPEERCAIFQSARPELRLFILAALQTGARRGELVALQWSDIDMKIRTVTFANTKNGERRVVPLTDALRETLQALPRPLDPQARVFAQSHSRCRLNRLPPPDRGSEHFQSAIPRPQARCGQHVDHGRSFTESHHGNSRPQRPTNDPALSAPFARAPTKSHVLLESTEQGRGDHSSERRLRSFSRLEFPDCEQFTLDRETLGIGTFNDPEIYQI